MTWGFGQITNNTQQILLVDYSIAPSKTLSGSQLNTSMGNALLDVGAFGVVQFTDVGHVDGSSQLTVQIDFSEQTQYWHYDNNGSLDVTISAEGMLTLTGQGQTITGALT